MLFSAISCYLVLFSVIYYILLGVDGNYKIPVWSLSCCKYLFLYYEEKNESHPF